jgi:small subunit ribosomal protein S4
MEKQFRKYVDQALKTKGNTSDALFKLLESRLDNVIFRLGFAESRPQARQLVSHRHIFVNGKKVNIPSFLLKPGDAITLATKTAQNPFVKKLLDDQGRSLPEWLDRKGPAGSVKRFPTREDIKEPFSENDIVEFYSR